MKKLVTLLLAAGLVFAASQPASAIEFNPFGSVEFGFNAAANMGGMEDGGLYGFQDSKDVLHNYDKQYHPKHFRAVQRFILGMDFVASENLSAHYDGIFGFFTWGGPATGQPPVMNGGALGTRAANIVTRQAYLDWVIPSTTIKVRMGQQAWLAPFYATGTLNPFDGDEFGSGILVTAPINDNVSVTAGWLRASSDARRGTTATTGARTDDNFDIFSLAVPVKLDGLRFTPWGAVGLLGKDSNSYGSTNYAVKPTLKAGATSEETATYNNSLKSWEMGGAANNWLPLQNAARYAADAKGIGYSAFLRGQSTVYFAGLGGAVTMFDPFRFAWDVAWSGIDTKHSFTDRSGWIAGASASYTTPWGVPTLKAWYGSGDDGNINNGSERGVTSGGGQGISSAFFGNTLAGGPFILKMSASKLPGTWGLSAQWNKASFVEGMFHNFRVTYVQGTNNKKMAAYADPRYVQQYLTTKDSVVEFDFQTVYSIYKNLAACLDLSYVIQDFDGKLWAKGPDGASRRAGIDKLHFSNAWNAALVLRYTF